MILTPLYVGLLAPINHFARGKVSNISFVVVTLWLDGAHLVYPLFRVGHLLDAQQPTSFMAALLAGSIVALLGLLRTSWVLGAIAGALSHAAIDLLLFARGDPPQLGEGHWIELALTALCAWLLFQYAIGFVRRRTKPHIDAPAPDGETG